MANIDILRHFQESTDTSGGIKIFKLIEAERTDFFAKLPDPFRGLYISDDDLQWRIDNTPTTRASEIESMIPDDPILMSGEFSEILCYFLFPEKYIPDSHLRPPKWKWKESKNIASHFTDVVLFYQIDPGKPSADDCIISIESKSRATKPSSTESSLQKAINDAIKDSVSRLAESLFFIKTRYKVDKNVEALNHLERFIDSVKFPPFLKHFKAVATVDDAHADIHIQNVSSIPVNIQDSFEVILIRVVDLKNAYEQTYSQMLQT